MEKVTRLDENTALSNLISSVQRVQVRTITATIDTKQAGFLTTPAYTAHITGPREFTVTFASAQFVVLVLDQTQIIEAAADHFVIFALVVIVSESRSNLPDSAIDGVENQIKDKWRIVWMGVEG